MNQRHHTSCATTQRGKRDRYLPLASSVAVGAKFDSTVERGTDMRTFPCSVSDFPSPRRGRATRADHASYQRAISLKQSVSDHLVVVQGPTLFCAPGLVKFFPAVVRLFCLALPGSVLNVLCAE